MLENINDYLSLFAAGVLIIAVLGVFLHVINLNAIKKNLNKEIKYYGYKEKQKTH